MIKKHRKDKAKSLIKSRFSRQENQTDEESQKYNQNPEQNERFDEKKISARVRSVTLDQWRNLGQRAEKERASNKIENYFTMAVTMKEREGLRADVRTQGRLRKKVVKDSMSLTEK